MIPDRDVARPAAQPIGSAERLSGGGPRWLGPLLRFAPLLVLLTAVAVYANSLANGFAYDDDWIIVRNPRVHDAADLRSIWLTPYWPSFGDLLGLYRPLTIFGFALQWAIVGDAPWLFHLTSIVLHAAVCIVGYYLLAEFVPRGAALLGALVFAVHPIHTEAVANVVGQAELIAALAVLAACVLWLRRAADAPVGWARTAALAGLYAAGLLAKEHAIVLPGLLVALDLARGRIGRPDPGARHTALTHGDRSATPARHGYVVAALRPMAWLFVVAIAYLVIRLQVLGSLAGSDPGPSLPYLREDVRLLTALRAWPEFARLLIWPFDLSADYSPGVVLPADSITPMIALGFLLLVGTVALALLTPRVPRAGLSAAWFLVSILPASNLLFPIGVLLAERTLYLPSFAVALAAAFAWQGLTESTVAKATARAPRRMALYAVPVAAFLGLMAARTVQRNPDWADVDAVMLALLRDHPESYRAQWSAAVRSAEAGDTRSAEEHWALAYAMWPRDPQMLAELGAYQLGRSRPELAVDLLSTARRLAPELPRPTVLLPLALDHAGRHREALRALEDAFRLLGPDSRLFELKALLHSRLGEHELAAASWTAVIRAFHGGNAEQWRLLGLELARAGRPAAAAAALDTAALRARAAMDPVRRDSIAPLPPSLAPGPALDSVAATRARLGL